MPPKKASPAAKTAPKTTTQRSAARATAKPVQGTKKPSTTAAKPGASGVKAGATAKKGSTSPTKGQTKGKVTSAVPQVLENGPSTNLPFLFPW